MKAYRLGERGIEFYVERAVARNFKGELVDCDEPCWILQTTYDQLEAYQRLGFVKLLFNNYERSLEDVGSK